MKYNLVKLIRNTQDQYVPQITDYDDLTAAKVAYHNTLAAFNNADDLKFATVKIIDEFGHDVMGRDQYGRVLISFEETVDNTQEEVSEG